MHRISTERTMFGRRRRVRLRVTLVEGRSDRVPRYVIERDIKGVGGSSTKELAAISQRSCGVLDELGPAIQWVQSFVTDDRIYCTYIAPNEEIVREHARRAGFPADRIAAVRAVIDPTAAEAAA
jgi:hypothetical protein